MDNKLRIASMLVAHRYAKNLTQTKVANKIGVTFQQVQKYERMINKITSDKLIEFCNSLDVKLQSFQDGDPYQVLDGADISILKKEKALNIIEILFYKNELGITIKENHITDSFINEDIKNRKEI